MLRSILTRNFGLISQTTTRASARPIAFNLSRSYHEKVSLFKPVIYIYQCFDFAKILFIIRIFN